ncbi:MAG TPA: hypothetical protein VFP72_07895 [Kineosporiaceae bacterium]|nr:hypothetical protein [Kineosporiaceae bacterium]
MTRIVAVDVHDVRLPISLSMDGPDAMNRDGDYSAVQVVRFADLTLWSLCACRHQLPRLQ